jgi:hypothetical protein
MTTETPAAAFVVLNQNAAPIPVPCHQNLPETTTKQS